MPKKFPEVLFIRVTKKFKKAVVKMCGSIDTSTFIRNMLEEKIKEYDQTQQLGN